MAEIKLVFKPDYSEVSKAIGAIKKDISGSLGNIKITVDQSSSRAAQSLAANLQATAKHANQAADAVGSLTKAQEKEARQAEKAAQAEKKAQQQRTQALIDAARKAEDLADKEARRKEQDLAHMKKLILQEQQAYERAQEKEAEAAEKAAQREAAAKQKAAETSVTLERQYSNLIRQIQNLKAQYPEGTFDAIEQQAREARDELRNLDKTTEDYANRVKSSSGVYQTLQRDLANARQETSKLDKVTESFWMNIQKFARWYIGGNIVTRVIGSLREALSTMKEVDTELANIQKVTDRTDQQMQRTAEAAYKVASAYGVAAEDYLESVGEFAKAGFGDMSEQLAEIATKTQLVGDVNSSIANKSLIASNAAWKMEGNVSKLNKTLDAANIIENNYATSIEKLAAGMPIAASVAAQAGMTFEETIAALGTITSVTQETGTKAATALRALILNIIGAVGEYEDGIEVTEESVKSLDGLLQVYAKDALAAAKAAGTVVNPMEAIAALAKASKEGLVNQAELFDILSGLGGKLRTNQLTALVQNYDTFLEMLGKTTESAGSAEREISVMLDTWEAKTNILRNTWTQFVSHLIDTGIIKDALDTITKLIDFLDTKTGTVTIKLAALSYVFVGLGKGVSNTLKEVKDLSGLIEKIAPKLRALAGTAAGSAAAFAAIVAGTTVATVAMYNFLTTTEEEYEEATEKATSAYALAKSEYDELVSKSGELTKEEQTRLGVLRQQLDTLRKQQGTSAYQQFMGKYDPTDPTKNAASVATQLRTDYNYQLQMARDPANGMNRYAWAERAEETKRKVREMADSLREYSDLLGSELPESGKYALVTLDNMIRAWDEEAKAMEEAAQDTEEATAQIEHASVPVKTLTQRLAEASEAANNYDTAIGEVITAMTDFGAGSIEVYNAMVKLEATIPGSTAKMYDFDTATVTTEEDIWGSKEALLNFIDTQKQIEFSQQINELEKLAGGYLDVAEAALTAMVNQQAQAQMAGVLAFTAGGTGGAAYGANLAQANKQKAEWDSYIATLRARKDYNGSAGSGRGSYTPVSSAPTSTADPELQRLQSIVSLEKAELAFLQASGKSLDEQNAKRREIQAALHDQAEYMRSIGADEEDILALSTEWWSIQKNINDDLAKAEEDRLKALEEEKKLRGEIFDTLKATVDDYYARLLSDKEKELTLEERILAVQQAEAALANAQRERNVRVFNASTGQWEWQANAKNVKSAQDALKKAQDDLNKYQREQAWQEFKSAWEYVSEQIKAGAMTFKEAYDYMYAEMTRIQDTYGVDLGVTLEDSIGGFKHLSYGIDGLTQEVANSLGASVGVLNERLKEYEDAVGSLKDAFDEISEKVKNGEMTMEDAYSYLRDRAKEIAEKYGIDMTGALEEAIAGMDKTNLSIDELWKAVIINLMKVNSARWFDANDQEKAQLHAQNEYLGKLIGATYDPSGYWYLGGSQLYGSQKGASTGGDGGAYSGGGSSGGGSYGGGSSGGGGGGGYAGGGVAASGTGPSPSAGGGYANNPVGTPGYNSYWGVNGDEWATVFSDPEKWANYSKLKDANGDQAKIIQQMNEAAAAGNTSEAVRLAYRLSQAGEWASVFNGNGAPSGFVKVVAGYGIDNGEYVALYNGRLLGDAKQVSIQKGTVFQDAHGGRWEMQEDGGLKALTPAFDRGGILKGMGGIKATRRDEFVVPPDLTKKILDPVNNDLSRRGLDTLRNLFDVTPLLPQPVDRSIGTQNNGDNYVINGLSVGEQTARTTTVYELARLARSLSTSNEGK